MFPGGGGNWGGSYLTVPANGANVAAAQQLADWLTAPEQQITAFEDAGTFPSQVDALADPILLDSTNEYFNNAPVGSIFTDRANAVDVVPFKGQYYFQINDAMQQALTRVEDGTQMRLKGKGQQGPGGAGDGLVTIAIDRHKVYRREGDDVRLDLPITLDEAVNGGKVRVPTVDGPVMMTIKAGTDSGTVLRLKGKGFTRKNGSRGDQLVTLEIHLPADLAELAKRLDGWKDDGDPRSKLGI